MVLASSSPSGTVGEKTRPAPRPEGLRIPEIPPLPRDAGGRRKSPLRKFLVLAVVLAVAGAAAYRFLPGTGTATGAVTVRTYTLARTSFDVNVKLAGELKAIRNVEIRNEVEGQTTILSIVPEGRVVKEGEELVRLASDAIKDRLDDCQINVENARAAVVNAEETLNIQRNQNESDIKAAEMALDVSRMELDQFMKGDSQITLATRQTSLENAKTDLERKTDDLKRIKELADNGFVSANEVLDAQIAFRDAENNLKTATMNLEVWNTYTYPKTRQTLERKFEEAQRELGRVKAKTAAGILLKEADLRAKKLTQKVIEARLESLEKQMAACTIKAPQPGMVVYQSSINSGGWGNDRYGPIEEGATVRQNQALIQLPDTSKMIVEVRIAEQLLDRVQIGQNVTVTVDAMPGKSITGKVERISPMPDSSNRWLNPNLKEYPTGILLDGTLPNLKPGMSARAEIQVARLTDVLAVPMQAVFAASGETFVYVGTQEHYEKRVVKTGLASPEQVEILHGLNVGETVLLSRPKDAPDEQPTTAPEKSGDRSRDPSRRRRPSSGATV